MRNAGLEEAQTGIKIAGRNINNLRYADDTTLMAESEEELKSPSTLVFLNLHRIQTICVNVLIFSVYSHFHGFLSSLSG